MGDFEKDTAVTGGEGRYTAKLSRDWEIWGPFGGYVAAVALRAAGAEASLPRPASFSCHYLGVASFDAVDVSVEKLRAGRRAESLRVSIRQGERPVLEALVWVTASGEALVHDDAEFPSDVPKPDECKPIEEHLTAEQLEEGPPYGFWNNVDQRIVRWIDDWENRGPEPPVWRNWLRLRPRATFEDPFTDAARLLMGLDVCMWPAASMAYPPKELSHIAPSLDLHAVFHRLRPGAEWMLVDGHSPVASDGLVGGRARIWDAEGTLLASGSQQMLCRPVPSS